MKILVLEGGSFGETAAMVAALMHDHEVMVIPYQKSLILTQQRQHAELFAGQLQEHGFELIVSYETFGIHPDLEYSFNDFFSCPQINIPLGYPPAYLLNFGNLSDRLNDFLSAHRITLWTMCQEAHLDWQALGLGNMTYAPWGFNERVACFEKPDYFNRFLSREDLDDMSVDRREYRENVFKDEGHEIQDLLFLGLPQPEAANETSQHVAAQLEKAAAPLAQKFREDADRLAQAVVASPEKSRRQLHAETTPGTDLVQEITRYTPNLVEKVSLMDYFQLSYVQALAKHLRIDKIRRLRERYSDKIVVYGNGWDAHGIQAQETTSKAKMLYELYPISLDLGSFSFETCRYPRVMECIGFHGLPLQVKRCDSVEAWGKHHNQVCFKDDNELYEKIDHLLAHPQYREELSRELFQHACGHFSYRDSLKRVITTATSP